MKATPEIKKFIEDNNTLSSRALAGLIESQFNIKISHVSIDKHLTKARASAQANNAAKVEAVRSKILEDADQWANKYLKYLDDEVESLRSLKDTGRQTFKVAGEEDRLIEILDIKDRVSASQALQKYLITVIEFVKPGTDGSMQNDELSTKLDQLIKRKIERDKGIN